MVKLVVEEPETEELASFIAGRPTRFSSVLAAVEVTRMARRVQSSEAERRAVDLVGDLDLIQLDEQIIRTASELDPRELKSLDAIHVASALTVRIEMERFVSYDRRQLDAARLVGLQVESPGE